jgi:uncharacterized repeat protein (TIGR02543 family)
MFRKSAFLILTLLFATGFILRCDLPQDPSDPINTRVLLLVRNSQWEQSNESITDSAGNSVQIGVAINLPVYIDSIKLSVKADGKALFDTIYKIISNLDKDTIWKKITFPDTGYKLVSMVPFSQVANLVPASAGITIVKKQSAQPENHPPKWTENVFNVALNDTARYELNLSPLCADPDKDALKFTISGTTLPGDTIIDNLYVFQASTATIGKNSIELVASDPSGLKDTMDLVLNVTASGSDDTPPEVTIIAPAGDSGVTTTETYVIDMLCSDASGIDSVYAVFNSKTISAVLENGHYKIKITDLVAGVYNAIELTVRDKSVKALKTTKTIKIKYVQSFAIAYNGNGNSSGAAPVDTAKYATGVTAPVKGNTGNLVRTGFTFAGWNTAADGSGTAYTDGSTFNMGTANVTLFARWTQNPTFTVTYDANTNTSGTVPSDAGKYEAGTSVTVKDNTGNLVKTGFTFAGWNTAANGSGTAYAAGATFKMGTSNITLFARWTQNPTFTVTYDGNTNTTGTVPSDAGNYETGSSVTVKGNTGNLVKTGFTFAGWNTAADGSGTVYAPGLTFNMGTSNVTLFARWTLNPTFTITYDANTGTGTVPADVNKYEAGAVVTVLSSGTLVKKGYTFTGWNTLADGSGTARASATTFNMPALNVTLYAQWKIKQYAVTYNGNGNGAGSVPVDANQYDTGASVTVLGNTGGLTKTGYTFDGWNTAENGSGTSFAAGTGTFIISSNTTLFAKWKIKTYTLSYAGNGNTGGTVPADVTLDSNALATVAANTGSLSKTGFDFNGWNTNANGSGSALASGATFRIKSDTTLYAQWIVKKYKLTIVPPVNGTVNLSGDVSVDSNATTTITATASGGFNFKCWRVTSGSAIIADTTAASTSVKLTQGNATIKAVFVCFTFEKAISYNNGQYISPIAITQGNDGYYYLAGTTNNSTNISVTVVIKLDSKGNVVATQTYGDGTVDEYVNSIKTTSDGCLVMSGTTCIAGSSAGQMNIRKISQSLTLLSQGAYSDLDGTHVSGRFAFETKSGSFILGGGRPASIFKIPTIGNVGTQVSYAISGAGDDLADGQEVNDGGFIFIGDSYGLVITKTDVNGKPLWVNSYPGLNRGRSIRQTADGGFIAGGGGGDSRLSYSCGLLKISSDGSVEWQKTNTTGESLIAAVRQTADGGFVYVSTTRILGNGENDMYLVKTNSKGEIVWNKAFGTSNFESANSIELTKDGGFIILGVTGNGTGDNKCYVIKTDENGNVE